MTSASSSATAARKALGVCITIVDAVDVDVADVQDGLAGQEHQLAHHLLALLVCLEATRGFLAFQVCQERLANLDDRLSLLIATLGGAPKLVDLLLDGLDVLQDQLRVDDHLIAYRIDATVYVHHVVVLEAAHDVQDGVGLADVAEELVA